MLLLEFESSVPGRVFRKHKGEHPAVMPVELLRHIGDSADRGEHSLGGNTGCRCRQGLSLSGHKRLRTAQEVLQGRKDLRRPQDLQSEMCLGAQYCCWAGRAVSVLLQGAAVKGRCCCWQTMCFFD